MVTHSDHNEHSVQVIVTEHGLADLRGIAPRRRPEIVIENCVDPSFKPLLREYLHAARKGHISLDLKHAFDMHVRFLETGSMLPTVAEAAPALAKV
jgi:acyl-CoA hydrolase